MLKKIRHMLYSHKQVNSYIQERSASGKTFDARLKRIYMATINGEQEWFIELVHKDPECAVKVIKECNDDD